MAPKSPLTSKGEPNSKPLFRRKRKMQSDLDREHQISDCSSQPKPVGAQAAIAAIISVEQEESVHDFINYLLELMDRNYAFLSHLVDDKSNPNCSIMVGAGADTFDLVEILYPNEQRSNKKNTVNLELTEEAGDTIAIAVVMDAQGVNCMLDALKKGALENAGFKCALTKGRRMGVRFAVLKSTDGNKFRFSENLFATRSRTGSNREGGSRKRGKEQSDDNNADTSPRVKKRRKQ